MPKDYCLGRFIKLRADYVHDQGQTPRAFVGHITSSFRGLAANHLAAVDYIPDPNGNVHDSGSSHQLVR